MPLLTDNKPTEVPSRARVQFTKPVATQQMGNSSRAPQAPTNTPQAPAEIFKRQPETSLAPASLDVPMRRPTTDLAPTAAPTLGAAPSVPMMQEPAPSGIDSARSALRSLSDDDIVTLLNEIASGSLRGSKSNLDDIFK